jgi:hypothetical protein
MRTFMTVLVLLVGLGLWACSDSSDSTGPSRPSVPHVAFSLPGGTLNCADVPNGGVVKIVTDPSATTIHLTLTPHSAVVTAAVYRDDPNTPGIQIYCRDYNTAVTWRVYLSGAFGLTNVHPQYVTIYSTCVYGPGAKLIASAGVAADTTIVDAIN